MGAHLSIHNSTPNDIIKSTTIMKHFFQIFVNPPGFYENRVRIFRRQLWIPDVLPMIFQKETKLQIKIVVVIITIVT